MRLSWKIFKNTFLLVLLALSLSGTIMISMTFRKSIALEIEQEKTEIQAIQREIAVLAANDSRALYLEEEKIIKFAIDIIEENWRGIGKQYRIIDKEGQVISENGSSKFLNKKIEDLGENKLLYKFYKDHESYYLQTATLLKFEKEIIMIETCREITSVFVIRNEQQRLFLQIILGVGIICGLLNFLNVLWLSRPIYRLTNAVKKMQQGDFTARVSNYSDDEIGILAENFNHMASRLEENISELKDAARKQEEFAGSLAHEIRTPLTSIIGYADLLRRKQLDETTFFNAVNYIFSEGKRLEKLSNKLLELLVEKSAVPNYSKVPIRKLLKDSITVMNTILDEKDISITLDIEDFYVRVDEPLMKNVLINIIDNAGKAVGIGGIIHIESKAVHRNALIFISDNGKGIPKEEIPKIQEAFYRVDKSRSRAEGGVGLGLAICANIMHLHGGKMIFESEIEAGTKVTLMWEGVIDE